jgi:RHS repeat-associated protein
VYTVNYDSFGNMVGGGGSGGDRFLFTGREWDGEFLQYYYRARYYDPQTARFDGEDPLGFSAGDTNLYRYVFNSPTVFSDPSGYGIFDFEIKLFGQTFVGPAHPQAGAVGSTLKTYGRAVCVAGAGTAAGAASGAATGAAAGAIGGLVVAGPPGAGAGALAGAGTGAIAGGGAGLFNSIFADDPGDAAKGGAIYGGVAGATGGAGAGALKGKKVADAATQAAREAAKAAAVSRQIEPSNLAAICESMARKDSDAQVQAFALLSLGHCYSGTNDERVGRLLASMIRATRLGIDVRRAAYMSLLILTDRADEYDIGGSLDIRIPEDVDWGLVRSFQQREQRRHARD